MKWLYLDPSRTKKSLFGFEPVALKAAKWHGKSDIRSFTLRGWKTFADLLECDPATGRRLKFSQWFVFAAQ
jgi:hypothetical protein